MAPIKKEFYSAFTIFPLLICLFFYYTDFEIKSDYQELHMKCPQCNFLNSNSRTQCLKCNTDLSELRLHSEIANTIQPPEKKSSTTSQLEKQIIVTKTPSKIKRTSDHLEIQIIQEKIKSIKERDSSSLDMNSSILHEVESPPPVPLDYVIDDIKSITEILKEEIPRDDIDTEEIESENAHEEDVNGDKTQREPEPVESNLEFVHTKKYVELSFAEKVTHTMVELDTLIHKWKLIYNSNLDNTYRELLSSLPHDDTEFELNPLAAHSNSQSTEVDNLYKLLLEETNNNPRDFSKPVAFVKSDTRTIDRNSIHNTLAFLRPKLLEEIENTEKNFIDEEENNEIPVANNVNIILSTCIDTLFLIIFIFGFYYWGENKITKSFTEIIHIAYHQPYKIAESKLVIFAPLFWLFANTVTITLFASSPGQTISGLKYVNLQGKKTSAKQCFTRALTILINLLSLGIRPLLMLKKKNGMACKISKTKITYASFVDN